MIQSVSIDELVGLMGAWSQRRGPRYLRLADAIAEAVDQDEVGGGATLPPERALADALGISRGTAVAAYGVLVERGVVARRRGSGTRVVGGPSSAPPAPALRNPHFGRIVSGPSAAIDLSVGAPYMDGLLAGMTADLDAVERAGAPFHGLAPLGLPALREGIAAGLRDLRATPTAPEQVLVTTGAQGALTLISTSFLRRGDRVIVESPTYSGALEIFSRAGASVVGVRRDHAGMRADDLERELAGRGASLVYVVPTGHNPTGTVMHEQRRREIVATCARHDTMLVEDQAMAMTAFDGAPPPAMTAIDPVGVLSVGSFSKSLWGGLRTGWVRASEATILRLARLRTANDLGGGLLDQAAALSLLPRIAEISDARRRQAAERHDVLARALAERLPEWRLHPCRAGWSLWVQLPGGASGDVFASAALGQGVAVLGGRATSPGEEFLDHVRLCFSAPPDLLVAAAERLARAWESMPAERASAVAV